MYNTETWIKKSNELHGGKYDYSKVVYRNWREKVEIICHKKGEDGTEHGSFFQIPNNHLRGRGCPKCQIENAHDKFSFTQDKYIELCVKKYGDTFDYSKTKYYNMNTPITVICKKHGEFITSPRTHLYGKGGCKECNKETLINKQLFSTEDFISLAKQKYGDFFVYAQSVYKGMKQDIEIVCPKHGSFITKPYNFLNGKSGCPHCRQSSLELMCSKRLQESFKTIEREKRFEWLGLQSLDFYLPEYNVAIECQGIQHFEPRSFGCKNFNKIMDDFQIIQERDSRKRKLCEENGIKLLYYSNLRIDYPYKVYEDLDELIKEIKSS